MNSNFNSKLVVESGREDGSLDHQEVARTTVDDGIECLGRKDRKGHSPMHHLLCPLYEQLDGDYVLLSTPLPSPELDHDNSQRSKRELITHEPSTVIGKECNDSTESTECCPFSCYVLDGSVVSNAVLTGDTTREKTGYGAVGCDVFFRRNRISPPSPQYEPQITWRYEFPSECSNNVDLSMSSFDGFGNFSRNSSKQDTESATLFGNSYLMKDYKQDLECYRQWLLNYKEPMTYKERSSLRRKSENDRNTSL